MLNTTQRESQLNDVGIYPIQQCIDAAIQQCNLTQEENARISIENVESLYFKGSLSLVTHVLMNLIQNAFKYAGNEAQINIWCNDHILFVVDYGKGIESDILPNLFNRFYTEGKIGTGLGLAFCRAVMEDLGGSIRCQSVLGKYTEFALIFPKFQKEDI